MSEKLEVEIVSLCAMIEEEVDDETAKTRTREDRAVAVESIDSRWNRLIDIIDR